MRVAWRTSARWLDAREYQSQQDCCSLPIKVKCLWLRILKWKYTHTICTHKVYNACAYYVYSSDIYLSIPQVTVSRDLNSQKVFKTAVTEKRRLQGIHTFSCYKKHKGKSQVSNQVRRRTRKNRQVTGVQNSEKFTKIRPNSILAGSTHKKRAVTRSRFKLAFNAGHESWLASEHQ